MKKIFLFLLLFFFILPVFFASQAFSEKTNKFGVHLSRPEVYQIERAAELVNSSGGEWGFVVLVMQEDERKREFWQEVFDRLRQKKLIPIIRLATKPEGGVWKRPKKEQAKEWAEFLNSLNWVVKKRYVILFNEPNHASEWGGKVDPEDYAKTSLAFATALKEENPDFFVMLAGLDASAPNLPPKFMDEANILRRLVKAFGKENFEKYIDGWVSHSYPNPSFSASPYKRGRESIASYAWELSFLKSLGIKKDLSVFITETGWDGEKVGRRKQGEYLKIAYESLWLRDSRVVMAAPFVLSYFSFPFEKFSLLRPDGSAYPVFEFLKEIPKEKGKPEIEEKGFIRAEVGTKLTALSNYTFRIFLENSGQAIWDESEGYHLQLEGDLKGIKVSFSKIKDLEPFEQGVYYMQLTTLDKPVKGKYRILLKQGKRKILQTDPWTIEVLPLPKLKLRVSLFPFFKAEGDDFQVQIFDREERLVFKKKKVGFKQGTVFIEKVPNIEFGKRYRVVILKPYYLPRQTFVVFKHNGNEADFKPLLPLDFDLDGNFDLRDFWFLIKGIVGKGISLLHFKWVE